MSVFLLQIVLCHSLPVGRYAVVLALNDRFQQNHYQTNVVVLYVPLIALAIVQLESLAFGAFRLPFDILVYVAKLQICRNSCKAVNKILWKK